MEPEEPTVEDGRAPRRTWRHVRTAVTLLILVGFVVGAAWYSWNRVVASDDETDPTRVSPTCAPVVATDAPQPDKVELNVYNATDRGGLAREVASKMRKRGFAILEVDNDPLDKTIKGSAEVRSHPDQEKAASVVVAVVPGSEYVPDERESDAVDLVLGESFEKLAGAPKADETLNPCS